MCRLFLKETQGQFKSDDDDDYDDDDDDDDHNDNGTMKLFLQYKSSPLKHSVYYVYYLQLYLCISVTCVW